MYLPSRNNGREKIKLLRQLSVVNVKRNLNALRSIQVFIQFA